ncbi:MAG: 1-(5-phosphoribosyl)-5-[(5-phosphoribosylamino)methylideneamino]imidazole-4-carboxamide isomerase [Verrucomicrobiae bacterium]|nr:1-(5-phosphoribosyl)-5-[(5-phosphoribosylamino)methylideneamino]imidazole-4-carboxamide isomerase [Verrucomicrobiae bacterium]
MIILPAIDLKDGKVVRLRQGRADDVTVYSDDPVAQALEWERQGGQWLHLVDLDGAFTGVSRNFEAIRKIATTLRIPVEMGGGIRDAETVARVLEAGVSRVILGTAAAQNLTLVRELAARFGGEKIAVGIDAKNGKVAVKGWTEAVDIGPIELAREVAAAGARTIIYTDISTDGMLQGPNLPAMREMVDAVGCQIIASGGVGSVDDIRRLSEIRGLYGVIVGKALYDGKVTLPEMLTAAASDAATGGG